MRFAHFISLVLVAMPGGVRAQIAPSDSTGPVAYIEVVGELDETELETLYRSLEMMDPYRYSALLIDVNSAGGEFDGLIEILREIEDLEIPVYSLVSGGALSSAAVIALAADSVFMAEESVLGGLGEGEHESGAEMRRRKEMFAGVVEARGAAQNLGHAMVDPSVEIDGLTGPDSLLGLTKEGAEALGLVAGTAESRFQLAGMLGLGRDLVDVRTVAALTLIVTNRNWNDARIYAVRSSSRFPLGSVRSMDTRRFRFSQIAGANDIITFRVEFIGTNEGYMSQNILLEDGLQIDWTIERNFAFSSMFVRHYR